MSKKKYKSSRVYLENIVEHCRKIREYAAGVTYEVMEKRDLEFDAIVQRFQAMGENMIKIEKGEDYIIQNFPDLIDWTGFKRLRDVISHDYEELVEKQILDYAHNEINDVESGVLQILKQRYGTRR